MIERIKTFFRNLISFFGTIFRQIIVGEIVSLIVTESMALMAVA